MQLKQPAQNRLNNMATLLLLLLVTGLLAFASTHIGYEADWSSHGRNSLSQASIAVLAAMPRPLKVHAYASDNPELRELIARFIDRYRRHKADIQLEFINPLIRVEEARHLGIRINGELVLEYQSRLEHVYTDDEEAFTNALKRLLKGEHRWVYFLEGHGERSPLGERNYDYKTWAEELAGQGIRTQPFNLLEINTVPDNAAVLVIASPRVSLAAAEIALILDYLKDGGNLLWLSEPGEAADLDTLLHYFSVSKLDGVIIDASTHLLGISRPTVAVISRRNYPPHPATAGFALSTYFPKAAAYQAQPNKDWTVQPLLQTGELSWLETGSLEGEVEFDQGRDIKGPLALGLALERTHPKDKRQQQRVVIIGDGDFLANGYSSSGGNAQLGLRLLTWLAGDDELVAISGSNKPDAELNLDNATLGLIGLCYLLLLPGACCIAGFGIWWRRKRL